MDGCFCRATTSTRLDRGPHHRDRVSLVRGDAPSASPRVAAEFVRLNVDAIVTNGGSAPVIKQATSVIPIVFVLGNDPVGTGLVASLARPGGNITGLSVQQTETDSERLELLREVVPRLRRVAVMANVGDPAPARQMRGVESAARALGLEVVPLEIRRAEDIAPPSRRSTPKRTHFTSCKMHSLSPTLRAS